MPTRTKHRRRLCFIAGFRSCHHGQQPARSLSSWPSLRALTSCHFGLTGALDDLGLPDAYHLASMTQAQRDSYMSGQKVTIVCPNSACSGQGDGTHHYSEIFQRLRVQAPPSRIWATVRNHTAYTEMLDSVESCTVYNTASSGSTLGVAMTFTVNSLLVNGPQTTSSENMV